MNNRLKVEQKRTHALRILTLTLTLTLVASAALLLVLGSASPVQGRVLQSDSATLYVDPPNQLVSRCDTFTAAVAIRDLPDNLVGYNFRMHFNPHVVTVTSVVNVGLDRSTPLVMEDDSFFFGGYTLGAGTDADGTLAIVEFQVLALGTSDLILSDVKLRTSGVQPIPYQLQHGAIAAVREAERFAVDMLADQIAGDPFDVTITALDGEGSPALGFRGMVELGDSTGTLEPTAIEFDGPQVKASATITTAQQGVTITAQAQNACGVPISGQSDPFDIAPNQLAHLMLQVHPAELSVGETAGLTATLIDAYHNPVADGTLVVFETDLGELASQVVTRTTTAGVATAALTSQEAGTATVTATTGDASDDVQVVFNPLAPATLSLTADPLELTAGETAVLTATVVDAYFNPVADGTQVVFATDLGELGSQVVTRTTMAGVATATLTSLESGTASVTATAGVASDQVAIVFNPGPAAALALTAYPTELVVGETAVLTATIRDQFANPVANGTPVLFATDLGELNSQVVTRTTTAGVATAALSSYEAGTASITATAGAASDGATIVFTPGPAVSLDLAPVTATVTAGDSVTYTLTAADALGNAWDVTAGADFAVDDGAGGAFDANVYTAQVAGQWTVTGTYQVVTATAALTVTPDVAVRLAFQPIVDQTVNQPFSIVITAYDNGNVATSYHGTVSLADTTGTVAPLTATFASGVFSGQVTISAWRDDVVITATDTVRPELMAVSNAFAVRPLRIFLPLVMSSPAP